MKPFENPSDPGNSDKHHTGALCISPDCKHPAGTKWSPLWCFSCNVKRMEYIDRQLKKLTERQ